MIIYVNGQQVEVEEVEIYTPPFWKPQPKKEKIKESKNENMETNNS